MSKTKTRFVCQKCGHEALRWLGRCPDCGSWNSMTEEMVVDQPARAASFAVESAPPQPITEVTLDDHQRVRCGIEEFDRVLGGGAVPGSVVLIGGDPGIGKCVTADTRLIDPQSGALRAITDWRAGTYPVLAVEEEALQVRPAVVASFHERGVRPVVRVRTKLGRSLRSTPEHPVLTPDGWRPVNELSPGSRVASPRALPYFGSDRMPEHEVRLIAYILSDGHAHGQIGVTSALPEVGRDHMSRCGRSVPDEAALDRLARAAGVPLSELAPQARNLADAKTPVARFLERVGLRFLHAAEKAVPGCIFRLTREQLALFLRVLFTCDGSVFVHEHGQPALSYCTISRRLAEDVQHLLLRFGFVARCRTRQSRVAGRPYVAYEITLHGVAEVQRFLEVIGINGREVACQRIAAMQPAHGASTWRDTIPTGERFWGALDVATASASFREVSHRAGVTLRNRRREGPLCRATVAAVADAFPEPRLHALAYGDVYWDEIASITPDGEAPVFDLSVPGAANFVANDLIVHNSTLLTSVSARLAESQGPTLYVTGEESIQQVKMRADRLDALSEHLLLAAETDVERVEAHVQRLHPRFLVVDSIQTVFDPALTSAPATVSQVRSCCARLTRMAKTTGTTVFLVGHVTKEGTIAGPRVLEHMVDTVLYFEGDRFQAHRILRGVKNRFGSTDEIGIFEMRETGLVEVTNASELMLAQRPAHGPGSAVLAIIEGSRALLVEVQALVSRSYLTSPRRMATGVDYNRACMIMAILEKRCGLRMADKDVYVNVAGGLRVQEPAADLAIAVALGSSYRNLPVDPQVVVAGEVGLAGEVRAVQQTDKRLKEAARLGFRQALVAGANGQAPAGMEIRRVATVSEALALALASGPDGDEDTFLDPADS